MKIKEGFVNFNGYKTYYIVYGDPNSGKTPLLALHGGPGYPHYHLENLSKLADSGRAVVFYDQLGCGKSDRPDNPKLWNVKLFVDELRVVRESLKLTKLNILGHSWGGSLAAEYMLTNPQGIEKLILSSPLLDSKLWVEEAEKLKDQLPDWAAKTMRKHEQQGTTDSPEYADAYIEFKNRFVCRLIPYPKEGFKADEEMGVQVYLTMWGPSEAYSTGNLKNWSILGRLGGIKIPTLLLSGRFDEATPTQMELAHKAIPGSKWIVFKHSSHSANFEESEKYINTVSDFLN